MADTTDTHTSSLATYDETETSAAPSTKTTLFAPTARRLDAAQKPHTPLRRPDTPHPRLSKPKTEWDSVLQTTPFPVARTNERRLTYPKSYHEGHKREDFKHIMFLEWLTRS